MYAGQLVRPGKPKKLPKTEFMKNICCLKLKPCLVLDL